MAKQNSNNIKQYRKPLNINIGMIIFGVILIYILICVFIYATSRHIVRYEVQSGSLSVANVYKALALREETVVKSEYSGYVNYYAREGSRAAYGDLVCTVDESGRLNEMMQSGELGENSLSDADLGELKTEILEFSSRFDDREFKQVYDFKYGVEGTVLKLANYNILENINKMQGAGNASLVSMCRSPQTGIIIYSLDGYEELTPETVTEASFDQTTYEKTQLISNELIAKDDPVYKLSTSEDWSLVIPVAKERAEELLEKEYVQVKFLKNQELSWAEVSVVTNESGTYCVLTLNNSMITFCTDRYVDIELITEEEKGLKIPNSSIVEKEFFLVPKEYVTKSGKNESGVLREGYDEDGNATTEYIPVTVYNATDEEYYIDGAALRIGDYLLKPESTEKYAVSKRATLVGVYNINKGYADFKQIALLYQNDEYAIVKSNTEYGLNVYDYIVLDASSVEENDFIQ